MNSDRENARIEYDRALLHMMTSIMKDDNQLFKQFMDNDGFKRWIGRYRIRASQRASGGTLNYIRRGGPVGLDSAMARQVDTQG